MDQGRSIAFTVFSTSLGQAGLAWDGSGRVVRSVLPRPEVAGVLRFLQGRLPDVAEATPPPSWVLGVVDAVRDLLDGGTRDLSLVPVDLSGAPAFDRSVYEVVRTIPPGETRTYGQVAVLLGAPGAAQAVGGALGRNPVPPIVPCHRVLAAGMQVGGFSAHGGRRTKLRMLATEGVHLEQPTLFDL